MQGTSRYWILVDFRVLFPHSLPFRILQVSLHNPLACGTLLDQILTTRKAQYVASSDIPSLL